MERESESINEVSPFFLLFWTWYTYLIRRRSPPHWIICSLTHPLTTPRPLPPPLPLPARLPLPNLDPRPHPSSVHQYVSEPSWGVLGGGEGGSEGWQPIFPMARGFITPLSDGGGFFIARDMVGQFRQAGGHVALLWSTQGLSPDFWNLEPGN